MTAEQIRAETEAEWSRYIQTYILPDIERAELRGDPISWDWVHDFLAGLAADLLPVPNGAN